MSISMPSKAQGEKKSSYVISSNPQNGSYKLYHLIQKKLRLSFSISWKPQGKIQYLMLCRNKKKIASDIHMYIHISE